MTITTGHLPYISSLDRLALAAEERAERLAEAIDVKADELVEEWIYEPKLLGEQMGELSDAIKLELEAFLSLMLTAQTERQRFQAARDWCMHAKAALRVLALQEADRILS